MKKKLLATLMSFVLTFGVVSNVAVYAADFSDLNVWVSGANGYSKDVIGSIPSGYPDHVVAEEIATCIVSDIPVANYKFDATFAVKDDNVAPYGVAVVSNDDFYVFSINGSKFEVLKDEAVVSSEDIALEGDVLISAKMLGTCLEIFVNGELMYSNYGLFVGDYFFGLWAGGDFGVANVEASAVALDYDALDFRIAYVEDMLVAETDEGKPLYAIDFLTQLKAALDIAVGVREEAINQIELDDAEKALFAVACDVHYNGKAITAIDFTLPSLYIIKANTMKKLADDVTVEPADASKIFFSWKSSNPTVVDVNEKTGEIAALKAGVAILTVTDTNTELTKFISIKVTP